MTDKKKLDVFVVIDEDGDYECSNDRGDAIDRYRDNFNSSSPLRIVKVTLNVAPPTNDEVEVDVPDQAGEKIDATVE